MGILQPIIIQCIVLIVWFYLTGYLTKYSESKGTNQATKEDIGEITEIIEGIKADLLKNNEELKAELSLIFQHRLNIKSEEMNAIFDYNNKLSAWLYYLVRFRLSSYNLDNYKELKKEEHEFSKRQYKCDIAERHLTLFIHDEEFLEIKKELTISIMQYEEILSKAMHEIYYLHSKLDLDIQYAEKNEQIVLRGRIFKEISPVLAKYRSDSTEQYRLIHNQNLRFRELIYNRIQKVIIETSK